MPPRKKPVVKTPAIRKTRSQKKAAISPEFIESDASDGSAPEGEASDNLINDSGFLVEDSDDHDASEYDEENATEGGSSDEKEDTNGGSDEETQDEEDGYEGDEADFITSEPESEPEPEPKTPTKKRTHARRATPPPVTPTPIKTPKGKKRAVKADNVFLSESDDGFVPSPTTDSPKKARRAKQEELSETPPSPSPKKSGPRHNKTRQNVLDAAVKAAAALAKPLSTDTKKSAKSKSAKTKSTASKGKKTDIEGDKQEDGDVKIASGHKIEYLEDYDTLPKIGKLTKCGVFNPAFVDKVLKETYKDLPKLPGGKQIQSWKADDRSEVFFLLFSTIRTYYKKSPIQYFKELLCFSGDKAVNFANLSRVDPCLLCFKQTNATYSSQYICYRGLSVPTRLLMMGILYDDKTQEPFPIGQKGNFIKSMVILPFAMEIERNVTATCVVAGVDEFVGSIDGNMLTFSTRQAPLEATKKPMSGSGRQPILAKVSSAVSSGSKTPYSRASSSIVSLHGPSDDIPILDARSKKIKLPGGLKTIVKDFPRFDGRVSSDSVILMCYTNSSYTKNSTFHVSHNILWAAVLCTGDHSFQWQRTLHEINLEEMLVALN